MKCPHCSISFHDQWTHLAAMSSDAEHRQMTLASCVCPTCKKSIIRLSRSGLGYGWSQDSLVYPSGSMRPIAAEVPDPYAADFREAVLVLPASPKASAALSRRNLQALLRDIVKVKKSDLSKEIEEFIQRPGTPSELSEVIDAVRNVGNIAAHPMKDQNTGAIVEVEDGEAEWLLEVLEAMFDMCFVQPARNQQRRDALNAKLASAGKPPIK